MSWIDVSLELSPALPVWPGEPEIDLVRVQSIADGAEANVSHLASGVHIGTHIDAPLHFLDGSASVDQIPLEKLIGPAYVVGHTDAGHVRPETLAAANIPAEARRLLFKSRNSSLWDNPTGFVRDYSALTVEAAQWLVQRKVELVGVDYLSVAPFEATVPTHVQLLGAGVVVVEGLDLRQVEPGWFEMVCLPLRLKGSDGAPARVALRPRA